jgi:DNA-binding Lrp family transcriptional regulator
MMDEIDEKIIDALTTDARTSFRKIAKELDRSPDTIINRFEKLIDAGDVRLRGDGGVPHRRLDEWRRKD